MARDLEGKHIVVTGSNTGIGRVTAEVLAQRGAHVVLACRSEDKTRPVLDGIKQGGGQASFLALDLGSLASARKAAEELAARPHPIDIIIANAGLAGARGQTVDGFELAFGTNHLGHFSFVTRLLPRLRERPGARVVVVSSKSHYQAERIDWAALRQPTSHVTGLPEYSVSKLCNVLFARELARREGPAIKAYSLHPGVIASDVWREVPWPFRKLMTAFMKSNEQGAETSLYCATSPEVEGLSGRYFDDCRERTASKLALDDALARELWEKSEAWVA